MKKGSKSFLNSHIYCGSKGQVKTVALSFQCFSCFGCPNELMYSEDRNKSHFHQEFGQFESNTVPRT